MRARVLAGRPDADAGGDHDGRRARVRREARRRRRARASSSHQRQVARLRRQQERRRADAVELVAVAVARLVRLPRVDVGAARRRACARARGCRAGRCCAGPGRLNPRVPAARPRDLVQRRPPCAAAFGSAPRSSSTARELVMRIGRGEHERARAVGQRRVRVGAGVEQGTRRVDGAGAHREQRAP